MSETELHYMPHFYHVYQGYHPAIYEQISANLKTHYGQGVITPCYGRFPSQPNRMDWESV